MAETEYNDVLKKAGKKLLPKQVSQYLRENLPSQRKNKGGGGCKKVMCLY